MAVKRKTVDILELQREARDQGITDEDDVLKFAIDKLEKIENDGWEPVGTDGRRFFFERTDEA